MNQAVFLALMKPGDTFMGLNLAAGGHLTHGSPVNMSGKWFKAVPYGCGARTSSSTWTRSRASRARRKPKIIIAGGTPIRASATSALPRDRRRGRRLS